MSTISTLVFDLGGVLVDLNDPLTTFGFNGSEDEFWQAWLGSDAVRAYERGASNTEQFAQAVTADLSLNCTALKFQSRLADWLQPPKPQVLDMLSDLKSDYRLGLLSNTNPAHWRQVTSTAGFADLFDQVFLSFQTGLLKPDAQAYLQMPVAFSCKPERIHFFDDNQLNVVAAQGAGISATQVKSFENLQAAVKCVIN